MLCRSPEEVAACRGSKYNVVAINALLRHGARRARPLRPGRPAVPHPGAASGAAPLPAAARARRAHPGHLLRHDRASRARPQCSPARRGSTPRDLAQVSYSGPGWPGGMRLATGTATVRRRPTRTTSTATFMAFTPPRCRFCPDALAELADISVGDAWLDRFDGLGRRERHHRAHAGRRAPARRRRRVPRPGGREPRGDGRLPERDPPREAGRVPRPALAPLAGRPPLPEYPGLDLAASPGDRLRGVADAAQERLFRSLIDRRYPD